MVTEPSTAAEQFAIELRALHTAAGSPEYRKIVSQAVRQDPPVGLSDSSLSDWLGGKSVPSNPRTLRFLVEFLEPQAAKRAGYQRRGVSWWENLRQRARREKRPAGSAMRARIVKEAHLQVPQSDPVIATTRRHGLTKPVLSELVVDAAPPRPVWRSGTMLVINLESRPERAVFLDGMRPVMDSRQPPRQTCLGLTGSYAAGVVPPRMFTLDLDPDPALLKAEDERADFPFKISATDVEQFRVTISATEAEVCFHLEIDWTCAGRTGTTVIDNEGKPFEIYPDRHSDLHWGCGGRHKRGCPAERLAASSNQGQVRWFDESIDAGFIIPDCGGADLYFHRTWLVSGSAGRLPREGDLVAYEVERTRFEPRAVRVRFRR